MTLGGGGCKVFDQKGIETLAQVLKEMEFGLSLAPNCFTSWESDCIGHENALRAFPNHEANQEKG
jgi:predicted MarR family transcription regulator